MLTAKLIKTKMMATKLIKAKMMSAKLIKAKSRFMRPKKLFISKSSCNLSLLEEKATIYQKVIWTFQYLSVDLMKTK